MTHSDLVALEQLMDEFFVHSTSNSRKNEIQSQLNIFSGQKDSWKLCVFFVTHTSSQYVSMYALSTIENVINRQWFMLERENQAQLKNALYNLYLEQNSTTPHCIRIKLAKLLVDIAGYNWPKSYPDFISNILQLLQSERVQLLGLVLLRITSEESMNSRSRLTWRRKEELKKLLQQDIPQLFHIIISILNNLGNKPRHNATATPPPSPTHPNSTLNFAQQISVASFRPDPKVVIREALGTLQHLLTWSDLNQVPAQIISAIMNFTYVSSYAQEDDDMCLLAISTLNEILYRKCGHPAVRQLFTQLYHSTIQLMKYITCPESRRIETLSSDFMEKLSEMMCLLMEQHLQRLESDPAFSAVEFLSPLFELTIRLPSLPCYLRCLAAWTVFIDQVIRSDEKANKYKDVLQSLYTAVLNKMQYCYNYEQLKSINTEDLDADNQTEWQIFLKTSIELVSLVATYRPHDTFNKILIPWKTANDVYVDHVSLSLKLAYSDTQGLHCVLRDLASLTQTVTRLSSCFVDQEKLKNEGCLQERTDLRFPSIDSLIVKMIESTSIATSVKYYNLKVNDPKITADFIEVQSQLLAALKTWCSWILITGENILHLKEMVDIALHHVEYIHQEPPKISHAAAHLFHTISYGIPPTTLLMFPSVINFLQFAPKLTNYSTDTQYMVTKSCCNILIRPWGDLSEDDSQKRYTLIATFFDMLTKDFRELMPNSDVSRVLDVVRNTLPKLSKAVEHCRYFQTASKKLLYMVLKNTIDHALSLFPIYSRYEEISDYFLAFFLSLVDALQPEMGVEAITHAIEVFFQVAASEQQSTNLSGWDKLLQILQLVVKAPSSSYKSFIPGILQLAQNLFPRLISQVHEEPDALIALLRLLESLLYHRWNYFYISQVRLGHSPGCSDTQQGPDSLQQPEQLLTVLKIFGQTLELQDINTFQTSLKALESLNSQWKLYHKTLFRDQLLFPFITVLMQTLLRNSHALLTEDVAVAIYNMAQVNFPAFFSNFLPNFLSSIDSLTPKQRESLRRKFSTAKDRPTFIRNLQKFLHDVYCYTLCNSTLPLGSVNS